MIANFANYIANCKLPFSLASAPAVFCAVAEALDWVIRSRGLRNLIHYLNDFLLLGVLDSDECLPGPTHLTLSVPGAWDSHDSTQSGGSLH